MARLSMPTGRLARRAMLVSLARLARPFVPSRALPASPRELLVIRPDHLGDLILATPALGRLRARFPSARITALVGPWGAPIMRRCPAVDAVLECDFPWFNGRARGTPWQPYAMLGAWARLLRGRGFDGALNLRFDFWWGAALAYLAGVPYRVGYALAESRPFLSNPVDYRRGRHEVVQNLRLVHAFDLGIALSADDATDARLEFALLPEEREFATAYLASHGVADLDVVVAIHPGTRAKVKMWAPERFARLAVFLRRHLGATVLVTGGANERGIAERIAALAGGPMTVAAGDTTLGQLGALFERAALVIGVDSGPLHLAVALGRPTVHLFGPSDPLTFGPYGDPRRHAVVRSAWECSPCQRLDWPEAELGAHGCMDGIEVEQVLQAAQRVLRPVTGIGAEGY